MKILFYTQWWQPERCFKGLPFAKSLVEKGHQVQVLTGFPNYPTGKIFPPYRLKLFQREMMEGIKVNRVFLFPSHDLSTIKRILNYLSFMVSSLLFGPFLIKEMDVVYIYNLVTLWPFAALMKLIYHAKIVFDVEDIWPESIFSSGMMKKRRFMKWVDKSCKWIYSRADKISVLSAGFKEYLVRYGVPEKKIEVIFNWCDENDFPPRAAMWTNNTEEKKKLHILYAGTIGPVQGLESVIESAAICQERKYAVSFRLVGDGVRFEKIKGLVWQKRLNNCDVFPARPLKEMEENFAWADVLLIHLKNEALFRITIPSKVQAYLFLGKPVLMAVRGCAAALIEEAKAGYVCSPDNPDEMANVVESFIKTPIEILKTMGENGHLFYEKKLSKNIGVAAYDSLFRSLTDRKRMRSFS